MTVEDPQTYTLEIRVDTYDNYIDAEHTAYRIIQILEDSRHGLKIHKAELTAMFDAEWNEV